MWWRPGTATNPAGLLKENGRMGWETTTTPTPRNITGTMTRTGRAGMEAMAGEGGTTPITVGAERQTLRQKRGEGRGATAVTEDWDTGTTTRLAPLMRRPIMCKGEEKKGGIATITPIVHQKKEME